MGSFHLIHWLVFEIKDIGVNHIEQTVWIVGAQFISLLDGEIKRSLMSSFCAITLLIISGGKMGEITKNFNLQPTDEKKYRITCKECSVETIHSIITSFNESSFEDGGDGNGIHWDCANQIIQCLGCETVSFRTVSTCSEDVEHDHDGSFYPETIKYYPGRTEGIKSIESHLLPYSVQQIYQETILSIENEQYILAGIGVRAIVETICKDLETEGRDLYHKINTLKERSIVTTEGADTLHKLRVLGNSAAHEVKAHNSRQLELAMQIIEHMLDGTYIIPERVQQVFPEITNKK